jgi:hypothetical protein
VSDLAGATRAFFQSPAGKELTARLQKREIDLLLEARDKQRSESHDFIMQSKGVKEAISVIKTLMASDKTKKGGNS